MNRLIALFASALVFFCTVSAQNEYTVIVNPAENSSTAVRLNWHTDEGSGPARCIFTRRADSLWHDARNVTARQELITAFDSLSSKTPDGQDCVERVRFIRNTAELQGLEPATDYMYRFSDAPGAPVRHFRTAPVSGPWTAAVISDFHSYTPLPGRTAAAMAMLDTLRNVNCRPLDMILHVGDVCAWGGSYSFWRDLYSRPQFSDYLWAGVNGNHDNMDRRSSRLSNDYFRFTANNPLNGYGDELGVCYFFRYGQVLFIMLNSESMRSDEGLAAAQEWVKKTITENPAPFTVVVEHYQWFFATDGRTSQYGRWHELFDEYGVDLAIAGNNHIYARTNAIFNDRETDGRSGTVYVQTPSSDDERGQATKEWTENKDKIRHIWSEGPRTVGALLMNVDDSAISLSLYDRNGSPLDSVRVLAKH